MRKLTKAEKLILAESRNIKRRLTETRRFEIRPEYRDDALDDMERLVRKMTLDSSDYPEGDLAYLDLDDIKNIFSLLSNGRFEEAREEIRSLDTAIRDRIPDSVYDYLGYDLY